MWRLRLKKALKAQGEEMIRLLFIIVFVAALGVPFFDHAGPALFGIPFFYWYQMAMVAVSSLITFVVFVAEDKEESK